MIAKRDVAAIHLKKRRLTLENDTDNAINTSDDIKKKNFNIEYVDDESAEIKSTLKAVQSYHKLRQNVRGLPAVNQVSVSEEIVRDQLFFPHLRGGTDSSSKIDDQADLLDKAFHTQDTALDEPSDVHMEAYVVQHSSSESKQQKELLQQTSSRKEKKTPHSTEKDLFNIPLKLQVDDNSQYYRDKASWSIGLAEIPLTTEEKIINIEKTEIARREALLTLYKERLESLKQVGNTT